MYKLKTYNYYNNLLLNYNLLYLNFLIQNNSFIIFFNYSKLSNFNLLNLKNEILNNGCISLVLNRKYVNKIFSHYFKFLSAYIFCIFISNFAKFIQVIQLLNNINFFYSFNKKFSNIINKTILLFQFEKYNKNQFLHYIISKLIFNIIILLLYFIIIIIKYLNFNK